MKKKKNQEHLPKITWNRQIHEQKLDVGYFGQELCVCIYFYFKMSFLFYHITKFTYYLTVLFSLETNFVILDNFLKNNLILH